jgi:hypothetical protein
VLANGQFFFTGCASYGAVDVGELSAVAFFPLPDGRGCVCWITHGKTFLLRVADNLWFAALGARAAAVRLCKTLREFMHLCVIATTPLRTI